MKYLFVILLIFKLMFTHVAGEVINNVEIKNNNRITKETIKLKIRISFFLRYYT